MLFQLIKRCELKAIPLIGAKIYSGTNIFSDCGLQRLPCMQLCQIIRATRHASVGMVFDTRKYRNTQTSTNAITLVWGSLRLAPIRQSFSILGNAWHSRVREFHVYVWHHNKKGLLAGMWYLDSYLLVRDKLVGVLLAQARPAMINHHTSTL